MKKSQFKLASFGHQSPIGRGVVAAILLLATGCSPPQWASKKEVEAEAATVQPAPGKALEGVPTPDLAANLYGKMATETFPGKGACVGNLDGVRPADDGIGRSVFGWAWDSAAKTSVRRFVLVNGLGQVVAAGDGGWVREDVPKAMPDIPDPKTGWVVRIGDLVGHLDAFGVLSDGTSLCRLGRLMK